MEGLLSTGCIPSIFFIFCQILGRLSAYKNIYVLSVTDHIMITVPEVFIFLKIFLQYS